MAEVEVKPFDAGDPDWGAMAHVQFLRAQGGAASGYTADLIEQLHHALTAERARAEKAERELYLVRNERDNKADALDAANYELATRNDAEWEKLIRERDEAIQDVAAFNIQHKKSIEAAEAREDRLREVLNITFDFLGGVDDASSIRDDILIALSETSP